MAWMALRGPDKTGHYRTLANFTTETLRHGGALDGATALGHNWPQSGERPGPMSGRDGMGYAVSLCIVYAYVLEQGKTVRTGQNRTFPDIGRYHHGDTEARRGARSGNGTCVQLASKR